MPKACLKSHGSRTLEFSISREILLVHAFILSTAVAEEPGCSETADVKLMDVIA